MTKFAPVFETTNLFNQQTKKTAIMKKVFFAALALSLSALCFSCGGSKSDSSSSASSDSSNSSAASSEEVTSENDEVSPVAAFAAAVDAFLPAAEKAIEGKEYQEDAMEAIEALPEYEACDKAAKAIDFSSLSDEDKNAYEAASKKTDAIQEKVGKLPKKNASDDGDNEFGGK